MAEDDLDIEDEVANSLDEDEEGRPQKSNRKIILLVLLPLLLLVGGIAGLYFSGVTNFISSEEEPKEEEPVAAAPQIPGNLEVSFYELPEMLVNITGSGKKNTYLKVNIALELSDPLDQDRIKSLEPRIVDNFQVYLRELKLAELQGAAGMYRLKEELLARVNQAISPATVNDVLFKEMLIQ
ncbi:MAG: flagellar basal body-associated FliL family protein [Alphaproteobacteria bacterium]|nr:flagellar basal body-associated FliL family protein [Alphaproteobacteria bacterium]